MKTTNIFLEVDDMVYNLVVAPHKKNKTFSRLLNTLLKCYMEDPYVRASVEGDIDDLKRQSKESLDSVVLGLNQSLSNMGLFTDELGMTAKKGTDFFSSQVKKQSEDLEKAESFARGTEPKGNSDFIKEMDSLKKDMEAVSKQNKDIMDLLKRFMDTNPSVVNVQEKEIAATVEPVKVSPVQPVTYTSPAREVVSSPKRAEAEEPVITPEDEGMKKMSAFMMGNFKSF